jgi:WD40 repeat protein/serine/threonine protein kinase
MNEPDTSQHRSEKEIFFEALDKNSPEERAAFLDSACGNDPARRARVEALLANHFQQDAFMNKAAVQGKRPTITVSPVEEAAGTVIGRYKLLQQIGEGGCGVVYMAEQQEPVRRRVALKVIKLGMDTKQVIARFEAERQALALMDHPNIAKVFDAGATETGRPYFVMELVKGIPITRFCDENNLNTVTRLGLFVQVCQAIQHAHQKGIIHRDIKPSNILVADHDGVPVPKIIDFGIAKATTDQRLTDKTLFTAFEQFIGTPAYMSPEQAKLSGLDIDTRSDIYALGVLLYELLTGKTPFEGKRLHEAGLDEIRRIIREEEPVRPSTKLHTLDAAEQTTVARHRQSDPPRLAHLISGDLDWIVMKALEKDRGRRYETANGLAMDIQRHLNNEPVVARPPSSFYRFQKMVRRNKLVFAAASAVAGAVLVGLALAVGAYLRERTANANARHLLYAADMNLAGQAWDQNNLGRLDQLLVETKAFADRGFEWYYWQKRSDVSLRTFRIQGWPLNTAAFSPDGRRVITAQTDNTITTWDAATGRELRTVEAHGDQISSGAFSPDRQRIVTGRWDNTAKVWDVASGRELLLLKGHTAWITSAAFSPDGQRIVTSSDETAKVWDAASGRELLTLKGHTFQISSVAFSPDGKQIVTGCRDGTVKLWDATDGRQLLTFRDKASVLSVVFSPDGKRIVTGNSDNTGRLWDAANGGELFALNGHSDQILSVAFSADGHRIATGSRDHTAKVWEADTGRELLTLKEHRGAITSVVFSPDGQQILTVSGDSTAKLWDATRDHGPLVLHGGNTRLTGISSVAFSPEGQRIVAGGVGQAEVWDAASGRELLTLHGHSNVISSVTFSPDGERILTGGWDNTAKLWDAASGRELLSLDLKGHNIQSRSVAFSPDGQRIVTGCGDMTAKVWDAASGRELLRFSESVFCVAFSPDGKRIATGGVDNKARLFEAASGRELRTFPTAPSPIGVLWAIAHGRRPSMQTGHKGWIFSVAFSPDGQRLVTGSSDSTGKVWDAASGRELLTLEGHNDTVWSVAFSPDGRRIVTGSADRTAKVWEAASGRELLTIKGHNSAVTSVAFSPDGQRILTGSADGTARVWEAARKEQAAHWQAEEAAAVQH